MADGVLLIAGLPDNPLDAAAEFFADHVPAIRDEMVSAGRSVLAIVFEPAGHDHRAWRLAAVQELAREMAPRRVNGIVGGDEDAIAEVADYLAAAPGVTGQLLVADGKSGEMR